MHLSPSPVWLLSLAFMVLVWHSVPCQRKPVIPVRGRWDLKAVMLTEVQPPFDLTAAKHLRIQWGKEGNKKEWPHWHLPIVFFPVPAIVDLQKIKKKDIFFQADFLSLMHRKLQMTGVTSSTGQTYKVNHKEQEALSYISKDAFSFTQTN